MRIVAKRSLGFTSSSLYRRKEATAITYLTERATFWIAVFSVFAFVTGNMIGTHGWNVFWKSVLGEGNESTIAFTGTVPPLAKVPDLARWSKLGGDVRKHTYREVPQDFLIPLPLYRAGEDETDLVKRAYYVRHLGTYDTGRGQGSHPGDDIAVPVGTPVQSIANGIVVKVTDDTAGYGKYIMIKHPNVPDPSKPSQRTAFYSIYAHLSAQVVQEGAVVQKGEQIGLTGMTGFATGPHLHFQIDRDDAPWHPYWPFTSAEARQARLSFTQAIDAGLHRERGLLYTADPILFVQSNLAFTAPIADASLQSSSASSPVTVAAARTSPLTVRERRARRLAKVPVSTTLVAYGENVPKVAIPVAESTSASSEVLRPSAPKAGTVSGIRISHDGSFTKDRGWEKVTLMLLDNEGRAVVHPTSTEKIYLHTAFGRAEFKPAIVSPADFVNGVLQVQMLPLGEQTVVVQAEPFSEALSRPMKYVR